MSKINIKPRRKTVRKFVMFFQSGVVHPDFQKLCDLLKKVKYVGQSVDIPDGYQPQLLFPGKCRSNSLSYLS